MSTADLRSPEGRLASRAQEVMVQLVRALRTAGVHDLHNEATRQVIKDLTHTLEEAFVELSSIQVQCIAGNVYFNNEFLKLKHAAAFEAAVQVRRIYQRLGINEIAFSAKLDESEVETFLARFQVAMHGADPRSFALEKLPKVTIRPIGQSRSFSIDRKVELARTYSQLIVVLEEAHAALGAGRMVALSRLRRAIQQLAVAAEGQEGLLCGLTRLPNPDGALATHSAAVTSLVLLMAIRLRAPKADLMGLAMSALFHDLGKIDGPAKGGAEAALDAALKIASFHQTKEAIERCSVALEVPMPASGDQLGLLPGLASKMVAVACAYDRLMHPGSGLKGLLPDHAMQLLVDHTGHHFDRRVTKLFSNEVGLFPIGSLVKLSGGQKAIVIALHPDPALIARPTVKVIEEAGRPADYLLELGDDRATVRIVGTLDPTEERVRATHFLLA